MTTAKRLPHVWLVLVSVILAVAVSSFLLVGPREPTHQGITLTSWLEEAATGRRSNVAHTAILHMGTNAFPALLTMLDSRDAAWKKHARKLLPEGFFAIGRLRPALYKQLLAVHGFRMLGTNAATVVPQIEGLLAARETSKVAALSLAAIGCDQALSSLLRWSNHSNSAIRVAIAFALKDFQPRNEAVVSVLLNFLKDENLSVRRVALESLGEMSDFAYTTLPHILASLDHSNAIVRLGGVRALDRLPVRDSKTISALTNATNDPVALVRESAMAALKGKCAAP